MRSKPPVNSGNTSKGRYLLLGLLVLAALGVRMAWPRPPDTHPASALLAMDDSSAELPLTPPSLPADNEAALRSAHTRLETLPTVTLQERQQAANLALELGDLWWAETQLRAILRQDSHNRAARLTLAQSLLRQARFEQARGLYHQLLQEDKRDSDAYLGMADAEFAANHRPEAFAWLARGVHEGVQTAQALTTFAHRYQDWKDYPKAEESALRAIQAAPGDIDARLQLASIQVESGKLEAGYHTLEEILQKDPNNGLAHRLMGVTLMNATYAHTDVNRARLLLEKAVELNPKDADIYHAAAVIYRQQHLYRLAAQAYNTLLILDPTSLDGRYGLGQVYALLGKPELSRQQLALYTQLEERHRRMTRLSEDVTHHPEQAQSHAALGRGLISSGDYARAVPEYQAAASLAPHDAAIQTAILQLYTRLGWGRPEHTL